MLQSLRCLLFYTLLMSPVFGQVQIPAKDARLQYFGRWAFSDKGYAEADWPGVYLRFAFQGSGCSIRIQGTQVFEVVIDGEKQKPFATTDSLSWYGIAQGLEDERHTVVLYKRTESQSSGFQVHGVELSKGGKLLEAPARPERRIEFIGDSYTVGYGMESPVREPENLNEDSLLLWTTNAAQNFGAQVARSLGADYQINAFSGRGLVRNINGIVPDRPFGFFYDYTLMAARNTNQSSPKWNFQAWHPQVVVIGLGINDFQGQGIPADTNLFVQTYAQFLDTLRLRHPKVKFVLCATQVWPNDQLLPAIRKLALLEKGRGKEDVFVFEYGGEKTGLWWHPDVRDHQNIARELRPIVARLGGWMSR